MVVDDNIFVMLLTEPKFRGFINGEIADADTTEVLNALSAADRDEVDALVERALDSGGSPWRDTMEEGPMYVRTFQDPDGHVWEVMHMDMGAAG